MIIIGCDYQRVSNKLRMSIPSLGSCRNGGCNIARRLRSRCGATPSSGTSFST